MKKPDIVILHGWNLSAERFLPLTKELEMRGYAVFAPDLPGFGKEPAPKQPWHVADYAVFLKKYIEAHNISAPVLIGHSFGARVALIYAQQYQSSLSALVLTGAPGFSPAPSVKRLFFWLVAKVANVLFAIPPFSLFKRKAQSLLYRASGSREFLRAEGTMRQTFKNVVADSLLDAMQSIRVPCFLLWGEHDRMVPVAIAERMQNVIRGSKLVIMPGADHSVPFKEPKSFVENVEKFLKEI